MADETPSERRVSGGAMYDAARDSWEDHHLQQQPLQPHPIQSDANAHLEELSPSLPNDPHLTAEPELQNVAFTSTDRPQLPALSPERPEIKSSEHEIDRKPPHPEEKLKAYPVSAAMDSPPGLEGSRRAEVSAEKTGGRGSPAASSRDQNESSIEKKRKLAEEEDKANAAADRSGSKRKRLQERHQKHRRPGPAPPSAYSRRDADDNARAQNRNESSRRSQSPLPPRRSPTPEAQARQRKRPGGGARMGLVNSETIRRRQEERERAQEEDAMRYSQSRGVTDIVRQHYNAVPQRGREWRKTESKIKGLRTFNNWVKSTLIQKFSPDEEFTARSVDTKEWANGAPPPTDEKRLLVIDLGCGKGGDLGKWQLAPQPIDLYVGLDPADISISQARDRYGSMKTGRGPRQRRGPLFHAEFAPKDCFGEWLGDVPIVQQVGIDSNVGPGGSVMSSRWGGGGFDVVASMFTIHYAFESEEKTRQMLRNVAGCLKKGGRFLGVCPNSDIISGEISKFHTKRKEREAVAKQEAAEPEDGEVEDDDKKVEWGNSIYRVRFNGPTPDDGIFRPPFGWKYSYFMEEAVEEIPEYVVPWEAFRALTEDYNLELQYRKPFLDVWRDEKDDSELGPLSERMGVRDRATGDLLMTKEEKEAASFYHAFCFYKV
ncbi:mRNA capping enzyme-domain-containing protein [Aspergillus crustosus]